MQKLLLERFAYSPESTEGELFIINDLLIEPKVHLCWTIELPWRQNIPSISCIPEGSYWLQPHTRPGGKKSIILFGDTVSPAQADSCPRYGILFHPANQPHELKGCIAPGLDRKPGRVNKSVMGMAALMRACKPTFKDHGRMVLTIRHKLTEAVI